ncbi:MAG: ABC transporter permease [Candidatus Promineifilaceae bacterium]|jgi:peptide/nickel transport system permease protein
MLQYTIRRVLLAIPVLFVVVLVTFVISRSIPGDPCHSILGEKATEEQCDRFLENYGLNEPIYVQFGIFLQHLMRGDLGDSIRFSRPVSIMLVERLPMTIELGVSAMFIAVLVGLPLGIISATRRNSFADVGTMIGANLGVSIPVFFLGLMLIWLFAVFLKDTPLALPPSGRLSPGITTVPFYEVYNLDPGEQLSLRFHVFEFIANLYLVNSFITGQWETFLDAGKHLILPAVALATIPLSIIARMTRSSMLEVLGQDYVRTARAKGLSQNKVVMKHAFRNALLPVVTIVGLQMGSILGGAVLTETIFGLAGVGRSVVDSIFSRDFPVLQGFVIVIAFMYIFFNLVVDLSYSFLDPRVKLD